MSDSIPNFTLGRSLVLVAAVTIGASGLHAQELSYQWKPGQKFSYQMEVVVDADDEKITYKGIVHYVVNNANANQASITYRGGLTESKQQKGRPARGFGPFGPRGFGGPPSIPSPFSRPTFTGKTQTTNKITITPRGETLAMEGDSQLPYLLGNVSLLPFEPVPGDDEKRWTSDSGVAITEKSESDRGPFGRFGPLGPFGEGADEKSVQAAGEVSNFVVQKVEDNLVMVDKTYRLHTPKIGDKPAFEMTGKGTWTFDTTENVPHAYDMKFSLNVKDGNTSTMIPITVNYTRISAEKIAEMEAAAKQKADEIAKNAAEKKAMAEAPLTEAEKSETLVALGSGDPAQIQQSLGMLAEKSVKDPDPQIAAAIANLLDHADEKVASAASKALTRWSTEHAKKMALKKDYQGPSPVNSTGLVVESITPLYVGQLVQAQRARRGSFWRPARVKKLLPDGTVELAFLTWGKENARDIEMVTRRSIQLAPPELEQPAEPAVMPAAPVTAATSKNRTWTDSTGRFKVEAEYVSVADGNLTLRRTDGRTMTIPVEKLSKEDQAHLKEREQRATENPFKLD